MGIEEKRRYARETVFHIKADLSHGHRIFTDCKLVDVSLTGVCIRGLSSRFMPKREALKVAEFTAVIVADDVRIKLKLTPKWFVDHAHGNESTAGFQIKGEVTSWIDFVRRKTQIVMKKREDIWGRWTKYHEKGERLRV